MIGGLTNKIGKTLQLIIIFFYSFSGVNYILTIIRFLLLLFIIKNIEIWFYLN